MKNIRYFFEYIFIWLIMALFGLMALDAASALGGWLGRTIGPRLATSRKALANIKTALPGRDDQEYGEILAGMWDNLGRVMAEYPHLRQILSERVELIGSDILETLKNDDQSGVVFGAHLANWEAAALTIQTFLPTDAIYRAPNNPAVDHILTKARNITGDLKAIPKSKTGARQILRSMKEGRHIGILIDQKYNEGLAIPFFGRDAMTSPAFAELPQKFKCPLVPGRIERLEGAHFRVTIYPPLPLFTPEGTERTLEDIIGDAHKMLEEWIIEHPAQWLWLHRRWPG
ncbi:MAG: lipid A biosynthesis acyltransferase [Rhodospirillales bacterium]|nr:lipid A biosynthesis acyltransferase [Rhodospirillales bacterium]